jgi:enoyl-CoA hydratase
MPRFRLTASGPRIEIVFDDGGMNLLSSEALGELGEIVAESTARERGAPKAAPLLVFRSGRPGLFAAGADMAEMERFTPGEAREFARRGQELFERIERLPIATAAVIDGDCFGGALDLAMAFDVRIATPRSRFAHPGARLGIATGFGGTTRWRKLLNRPAANALFISNRVMSAAECGLVDEVTEHPEEILRRLEEADPRAVRLVKELTSHAPALTPSQLRLLARRLGHLYFGAAE